MKFVHVFDAPTNCFPYSWPHIERNEQFTGLAYIWKLRTTPLVPTMDRGGIYRTIRANPILYVSLISHFFFSPGQPNARERRTPRADLMSQTESFSFHEELGISSYIVSSAVHREVKLNISSFFLLFFSSFFLCMFRKLSRRPFSMHLGQLGSSQRLVGKTCAHTSGLSDGENWFGSCRDLRSRDETPPTNWDSQTHVDRSMQPFFLI